MKNNNKGFTLIELLVVISIVGLLSSVVLAAVTSARDKGRISAGLRFAGYVDRTSNLGPASFSNDALIGAGALLTLKNTQGVTNGLVPDTTTLSSDVPANGMGNSLLLNPANNTYIRVFLGTTFNPDYLPLSSGFMISSWVKTTLSGVAQMIGSLGGNFNLAINASGGLDWSIKSTINGINGTLNTQVLTTPPNLIVVNKWHHVAAKVEDVGSDMLMIVYVDGQEVDRQLVTGQLLYKSTYGDPNLCFGAAAVSAGCATVAGGFSSGAFQGYMDNPRYVNFRLSP